MKKYLYGALALPLLFACSSDDLLDKKVVSNDQFPGIEKVDATFVMDEGQVSGTRMDDGTGWTLAEGDKYGFAWLGGGEAAASLAINGKAWQNHPLTQTDGIFKPATSIYVGNYFLYRPYDETTVNIDEIKFNSLKEQTISDGMNGQPWKDLAETAIIIGDKWTNVTTAGTTDPKTKKVWEKAGIGQSYHIYAAFFSNQTALDLTYEKNNVAFTESKIIKGATDIEFDAKNTTIGAADIYGGTVELTGAANSFTYAPTVEPNAAPADHSGTFWADKKNLAAVTAGNPGDGFTFTPGEITLNAPDENGFSTDKADNKGWFWFNSLPVTAGNGAATTNVTTKLNTSYGIVTITKKLEDCAYAFDKFNAAATTNEWIQLAATDDASVTPKKWAIGTHNTFVNQYGNHKGKYALKVDFTTGDLNGMHVKNDAQLQKALKYYIATGKASAATLNLDADEDGNFEISKISIALLQFINAAGINVTVQACGTHGPVKKVIVTQDGQAELGLADKKEVPALDKVFAVATPVYLSSDCEWTWNGGEDGKTALTVDAKVKSITNEGTLTVNATNVQLSGAATLGNAEDATMNITKVTTVKNALTNLGTINVGSASNTSAELRAYGVDITNDATKLDAYGVINNYGVIGVTAATTGTFNNYGYINMMNNGAMTLLTTNEIPGANFGAAFNPTTNKMGTVVLPNGNPLAIVSVANLAETGFIKYNWTQATYTHATGNVKYNTLVVSNDIDFTGTALSGAATEVKYIEFNGTRTQVVNPTAASKLTALKGIIVNEGKSIVIEKNNEIICSNGAFLGKGATVYQGGIFTYVGTANYFGTWSTDQIVVY